MNVRIIKVSPAEPLVLKVRSTEISLVCLKISFGFDTAAANLLSDEITTIQVVVTLTCDLMIIIKNFVVGGRQ